MRVIDRLKFGIEEVRGLDPLRWRHPERRPLVPCPQLHENEELVAAADRERIDVNAGGDREEALRTSEASAIWG